MSDKEQNYRESGIYDQEELNFETKQEEIEIEGESAKKEEQKPSQNNPTINEEQSQSSDNQPSIEFAYILQQESPRKGKQEEAKQ